jgi:hypothetical protein
MSDLATSRALHERVRAFAQSSVAGEHTVDWTGEFERLACDIASFQSGAQVTSIDDVVRRAVPSDCFRLSTVFKFSPQDARARFVTSGTTSATSGTHYLRDPETYELVSLLWGERCLLAHGRSPIVLALAPWTGRNTTSSLGYMMQRMMERFDGRGLTDDREPAAFRLDAPARWLVREERIDLVSFHETRALAWRTHTPVLLLATSFALVELLDALNGETLELPPGSVVMPTGGFKGRTRSIERGVMHRELRRVFGAVKIIGEYGMTELSSQLYEVVQHDGAGDVGPSSDPSCGELPPGVMGIYTAPAWLRVYPLDPHTLVPVPVGEVGLACFVDLANVDSAVCLITQDLVRVTSAGLELLGRQPKAPLRGCSLAIEAIFNRGTGVAPVAIRGNEGRLTSPPPTSAPLGSSLSTSVQSAGSSAISQQTAQQKSHRRDAAQRIWGLVGAAAQVQERLTRPGEREREELSELTRSTGLSEQAVFLALSHCLETHPEADDVEELVSWVQAHYGTTQQTVWVVLSSNVFTVPLRAIALGLASGKRVKVRASRREPTFTRLLHERAEGYFEVVEQLQPVPGDKVIAFGSDETLTQLANELPAGVEFIGHGHGMGVAVIGAQAGVQDAAERLAFDVVLLEQQGCLSPRLVIVEEGADVDGFLRALGEQLRSWAARVPKATFSSIHQHEATWSRRVAEVLGQVSDAADGWLARFDEEWVRHNSVPIPPACRSLSVVVSTDPVGRLATLRPLVTTVGVAGDESLESAVLEQVPHARVVSLGRMQTPRLDGPVDRRPPFERRTI